MATQWHYQRLQVELGPVAFEELVRLVRAEQLAADDLVREEWNQEWRPAALAVGLFHMAGRQDLVDRWEAEQEELRRQAEAARAAAEAEVLEFDPDEPAWMRRLREVQAQQRNAREEEAEATRLSIDIDDATEAALAELEAREKARQPTRLQRWIGKFVSPATLHRIFRWGLTLLPLPFLAMAILNWSNIEAQRFPVRSQGPSEVHFFPLWGPCDQSMYYFLLFDALLACGVVTYLLARILERCVDD